MKTLTSLLLLFVLVGCKTTEVGTGDTITKSQIESLPELKVYHDDQGKAFTYTRDELMQHIDKRFWKEGDPVPRIHTLDRNYVVVDHDWMLSLINWNLDLFFYHDVKWKKESFDCDNFADALKVFAFLSGAHVDHLNAQVIVGTMVVQQQHDWAGVPAGGSHALNFFISNKGIFVVEPNNGDITHFENYPNRHTVKAIYFD